MDGGKVIFKFLGDDKDLNKKTNSIGSTFGKVGKLVGGAMVAGTAVAGTALAGLVAKGVKSAGELEQQIGGTEAVFGKYAKSVQENASKAFKSAGISANDYMTYANKIGSLMKGSGIETKKAMDLSSQAMQRASDVASIMGIDVSSAMEAITGAAKGNFTMMDNLGVAMNATNLQAYALEQGITKSYNSMTQAEKVGLAYQMFLDKTSAYAGNYAKENETFAGSFQTLKSATENFMSGSGGIEDVIDSLTDFGKILTKSIGKVAPKIVDGIVKLVDNIIIMLPDILNNLLPVIVKAATNLVKLAPQIFKILLKATILIINSLADELPNLMPEIVDAILGLIPILMDNIPLFVEAGYKLGIGMLKGIIKSIPKIIAKIPSIAMSIINAIAKSYGKLQEVGQKIINKIRAGLLIGISKIKEVGKNLINGLWQGIQEKWNGLKDKTEKLGKGIVDKFKSVFGVHSPSVEFAYIGKMNMLGLQNGMEDMKGKVNSTFEDMLDFSDSFNLSPNIASNSALNMSPIVNVVNNINMKQDPLGQMVSNIKTFSGGAKNDFNYGMGG